MSFMKEFDHLKIQLKDVVSATNNFGSDKLIGRGGFGPVYKGELYLPEGRTTVAFKRLDPKLGQGTTEFWKEIMMLSKYKHENLVSLLGFCNEGGESILAYKYASNGSLDRYLSDARLTWSHRLKICVEVAHALNYLHDPMETQQRVLHRDIKSSNILLDEKWRAKVSDFGLSKIGPANQQRTYLFSNGVGTLGYFDPLYMETGILSKESDVYSFGVVLFEVICGRLCYEYRNNKQTEILVPMWRKCYDEKRLDEIIFLDLKEQITAGSLNSFLSIAYRCVKKTREERPMMAEIVKELEFALRQQEFFENIGKRVGFEEMIRIANREVAPPFYGSQDQVRRLFSIGIALDDGKTWISINKKGEIIEMISATKCIFGDDFACEISKNSRYSYVLWGLLYGPFKIEGSTQFLLPGVKYAINLVFKHWGYDDRTYVHFKYKLVGETHYSTSSFAHRRDDGWLMIELYQFISQRKDHDFRIEFLELDDTRHLGISCYFEGIEFRPADDERGCRFLPFQIF